MPAHIVKERVWPALDYQPHVAQRRVHSSVTRNRVNAGGRRMGKSWTSAREVMPRIMEAYANQHHLLDMGIRYEGWIIGPNYTDTEKIFRVVYNDCAKLGIKFDKPGTYYTRSEMSISLFKGAFMLLGKSAAKPESLVGEGLHFAIMTEAAKMKESVWERFVRPTLADFLGESWWDSTPEGKNWFYELYRKGQDPNEDEWASWRSPSWLNRRVYGQRTTREAVQRMKELIEQGHTNKVELRKMGLEVDHEIVSLAVDLTPEAFGQEIECSFTDMVGRVFKRWDEDAHVMDLPYNPAWPLYLATDYGYTHPNVCLFIQVGPFGDIHVIAEYYQHQRTDEQFRDDVLKDERLGRLVRKAVMMFPDPEDPGATKTLSDGWKVAVGGSTGGLVMDRVRAIQRALAPRNAHLPWDHPERKPMLVFDRSCENGIREMDAYSWPRKRLHRLKGPEKPQDKDDHVPEALGRFFAGFGVSDSAPVLSQARMGGRRGR